MKMICPKCQESIRLSGEFGPRLGATVGGLAGTIATRGLRGGLIGAAVGSLIGVLYRDYLFPCTCRVCGTMVTEPESTPTTATESSVDEA